MQGNCTDAPLPAYAQSVSLGGARLAKRSKQQCLILTDTAVLSVTEGDLWLGHVLMRFKSTARSKSLATDSLEGSSSVGSVAGGFAMVRAGAGARLWMTNVTLQGHGEGQTMQALASEGPVLCRGEPLLCSSLCILFSVRRRVCLPLTCAHVVFERPKR
jgi:hypothetical protein